jgi:hypothetical protein
MFFNIIYRSPIWQNLEANTRNIRILILGSIFYIIIHSFIYSRYVNAYQMVLNYRKYIYYLIMCDLAIVGLMIFLFTDSQQNKKEKQLIKKKNKKKKKKNPMNLMNHMRQFPIMPTNLPINLFPPFQQPTFNKPFLKPIINESEHNNPENKFEDIELPIYQSSNNNPINTNKPEILDTELPIYAP